MRLFRFAQRAAQTLLVSALFLGTPSAWARVGITYQTALGNPDNSVTEAASRTKYLIQRPQYHLSYNDDTHQANWVSWSYSSTDSGSQARTDAWAVEELLPSGYLRIGTSTFGTSYGIQWDRGHMTPSADRTANFTDNAVTFRMSNIIPQASSNNQGLWAQFETYCRGLAGGGNEVLIISGPSQFTGNRIPNSMAVPGSVWKIAVVVPDATSSTPANQRITTSSRVIALLTPNVSSGLGSWQSYITSVEEIEEVTGFNFFTEVDPSTAIYLKNVVDTGTAPNNPTVITTFNPTLGGPGTAVTISGYNFNAESSVQFNGIEAASVSYVGPNQLVATVPAGATTGPITADGTGGFDTSYEDFTVTTGPSTPTISVSPATIASMTATEGAAGAPQIYAVNGTNLTSSVTVTAPTHFEISADGTNFSASLTLTPGIDGTLGTQVSVRIASGAPVGAVSGNISHASAGAAARNVAVSGNVASSAPQITTSVSSLAGFTALSGNAGASKTYTVSGANLTGDITITAPAGYEAGLDNTTFATTVILSPVSGSIAATTVYIRLGTTASLGSNTGSITHAGGGAAPRSVSVAGAVTEPGGEETWIATSGNNTKGAINTGQSFAGKSGAWVNEFHYDTVNTDTGEFVEVVVGPDVTAALTDIVLDLYNGSGGASYATHALSTFVLGGTTADGYRIFYKDIPGIQNGAPDGLGVSVGGVASGFLSYEGTFAATSGPANGQTSTDIGISETGTSPIGSSLQLTGSGTPATPSPVITVSGPATATALQAFTYQIQASENPTSYAASGLPEGLSVNTSTGVISGTPTTPGTYTVGLTATNAAGDGTATLTIIVDANPDAPTITSNLITSGQINSAFAYQITASNNPASYTAANLPAGLSINTSTGLISGTPTEGGTFNATITALNDFGGTTATLQILIRVPTLTLTPASLNPFTADAGFHSATQSYTVGGSELSGSITVRAPQNFEISTDGATFTGELVLTPAGDGSLSQAIIVRLADTAPPGLTSGALSHTGSGATPRYLEVSGTVSTSEPTLTVSTAALDAFTTTAGVASAIQTYELSGASLTGLITLDAPGGFEIGADEESFGDAIELTPVNGALSPTAIYVRLHPDNAVGSYSGQITHAGGGASAKIVAVSGSVAEPVGPEIIATSGGSAYVSASYSNTIQTDGLQTVTSYGATGLPPGLSVNSSSGVISGTPTTAGTYNVTFSATSTQGTSTKPYTLRVITTSEQPGTPVVVVNKFHNATTDRVELLVTGDSVDGPPVDLRGMIIKDFNSNMAADTGGKYVFADHPLWANVKAGTLVVLAAGNSLPEDLDAADFILGVNLANATYFTQESGGFDIGNTDMIMIKPAGMQPDGVAGGIHALAAGTTDTQYDSYSGRKTRSRRSLSGRRGYYCYVTNGNRTLADFYSSLGGDLSTSETFGSGNNADNTTYINTLRAQDQDGPVITVLGENPANIERGTTYADGGATAFDDGDNASRTVTTTGSVDTSVDGTYTLTYSAADSKGNIGTATRTVHVVAPATAPPTVSASPAGSVVATSATLNGSVDNAGTSDVSARGFVYSTMEAPLEIGAEGVSDVAANTGAETFSAEISGLTPGTTYYYRAYATNESGTDYSGTLTFTTLKTEPLQHAGDFAAGLINSSNITATWTPVAADGYLLVVASGAQTPPTDGVVLADDTDLSDGSGAVNLSGSAASYAAFTGFAAGETYTFRLYPFNNSGDAIDYKTDGAPAFSAGVLTTPELYASGSPGALTTTYGTPSSPTTFSVSGVYLTSTVSVTAPAGFEVSADAANYASFVTLTPATGTLGSTTVYLRLAATAGATGVYDGQNITVSGGGATSVTIQTAASGHQVSPKALEVTGLSAVDKDYDGRTEATVAGTPVYQGLANNESFAVEGSVSWTFADKIAGAGKVLLRTGSFNAPSANYTIPSQPLLTAEIRPKELTVTGAVVTTKTYDGNTTAEIADAALAGVLDGDTVTVSGGGTFDNANAGENKPVAANLTLGGADAANYTLVQPELAGTITKADQVITFDELPSKFANDDPFTLSANSDSGLAVTYSSSNESVATIGGNTVTLLSAGATTITASQEGNTNYNAATPVARTLNVSPAQTLIAGWDFQTTANGGTAVAGAPATPKIYTANFGSGTIYLDGSNGSSDWFVPASGTTNTELNGFGGTDVNATRGLSAVTTSPSALALIGGASTAANGKHLVIKFSMTGRANLAVTYAAQRTSTGFTSQTWEYSPDGVAWTPLATLDSTTITSSFAATGVITLPSVTALDNAPEAYLRVTVNGATASSGNNRIDNIQLVAGDYASPDTTAPVITVAGDNPLYLPVGATFVEPGASAFDAIDGSIEVQIDGTVDTAARGTYVLTYTASDEAGNEASATREVVVRSGAAHTFATQYNLTGDDAAMSADADGDGASNIVEYAFGSSPSSVGSAPLPPRADLDGASLRFTAVVRTNDSALTVTAVTTPDLTTEWTAAGVTELADIDQTGIDSGFRRRTWEVNAPAPGGQFIRLELSYP